MATHLTEEELRRLEARCCGASSGPWHSLADVACLPRDTAPCRGDNPIGILGASSRDTDFIANARADVDRLIKEVRRLRNLLAQNAAAADENVNSAAATKHP